MFLAVLLGTSSFSLFASITFGSRQSALNFATGTRFNIGSINLSIDGTFKEDVDVDVSGNPMNFSNGILESAGLEALMNGEYDPTGLDFVRLNGNGRFRAEPGTLLQGLTVAGVGNSIEGQPLFTDPVVLADAATELTFAIQNRLNQNVELNGGTLILEDDLGLADEIKFDQDGRIELNHRQLRFGSLYTTSWFNSIYFNNAADVVVNCNLELTGTWTFGGMSCLNGGGVLDLSNGGQIIVDNNGILDITNMYITGLGDTNGAGKIILRNANSQIRTANSTYKLDESFTINQGTFLANGPTTFQIGQKDWSFNGNGHLAVNGTTLWVDPLDSPCMPGNINAPFPLFIDNLVNEPNLKADLASGALSLTNRGTIKLVTDASSDDRPPSVCSLLDCHTSGTIDLRTCLCVGPYDCINIVGDTCLNGHGVEVEFTNQPFSQFKIQPGVTLLLKNITLRGINDRTISMGENSLMQIGENVIFELDTDVTFSASAVIEVLDGTDGCMPVTGPCNIFKIRGETCRRQFHIQPLDDVLVNNQPRKIFKLGHNTVQLENSEISGFDYMTFFNDDMCAAAIALSCNAAADINSNFPDSSGRFGTAMNFFVEGINNDLVLRQDGLVLSGNITFGDFPDNELHILFSLPTLLDSSNAARFGVLDDFPVVELAGNPGIFLFSSDGVAELNFDDFNAAVRGSNDNAFVVDDNGLLRFKRLQILDNPIKQQSARFRFEGIELLDQRIDPGFIRLPRGLSPHVLVTAIHIMRQREKDAFAVAQKHAQTHPKATAHSPHKPPMGKIGKKRPNTHAKYRSDIADDFLFRSIEDDVIETRSLSLPASFDQSYVGQILNPATPISGNIQYRRTELNNFIVDPNLPFNILMQEGTVITLGADVILNQNHKINVSGLGNVINMPFGMKIGIDNLFFDEGAELTFQFSSNTSNVPELIVADNTILDIEPNATLRLSGEGIATLGDGVVVNFKGVKTVHPVTKAETVSSRGYLVVTEDATLRLAPGAFARMNGIGHVEVTKRGKILLDAVSTLVFGSDVPTVMVIIANVDPIFPVENFQDIVFNVFDDGEVILKPGKLLGGGRARISFRYLTSVIEFENSAFLFIDDNGTFEINANRKTPNPSKLKNLSFRAGILEVRGSGRFAMGSNKLNLGTGQPYPFSYDGVASLIEGTGKAQFIGLNGFEGFINPTPAARDEIDEQTAVNLTRSLIGLSLI